MNSNKILLFSHTEIWHVPDMANRKYRLTRSMILFLKVTIIGLKMTD